MNIRTFCLTASVFAVLSVQAQTTKVIEPKIGDFRIISIQATGNLIAPTYSASGGQADAQPPSLLRNWLRVEVQFETKLEWADDVKLVYYVVTKKKEKETLFKGEVTHSYVMKDPQHFSAMFMNPNAFFHHGGHVEKAGVQLFFRDRLFDQKSNPESKVTWWDLLTPHQERLLNPMQTPWSMIAHHHYEAIRESRAP